MTEDPKPTIWFDFEFQFSDGAPPIQITIAEGKWLVKDTPGGAKTFQFQYDDGATEEVIIPPDTLVYMRIVRREELPATRVEDGGRTKIVGSIN